MLQSSSLDISKTVDVWVQTLNDFRQESHEVLNISGQCDATLPAAKTLSSKLSEHCVLTTVGQKESDRGKNVFLTTFFYPVIDLSLGEITRRRILEDKLWHNEQHLGSQAQKRCIPQRDSTFARFSDSNIEDLGHELHQFSRILDRKTETGKAFFELSQWVLPLVRGVFLC